MFGLHVRTIEDLLELPVGTIMWDKNAVSWTVTDRNPKFGGDMARIVGDGLVFHARKFFGDHLPGVVIQDPDSDGTVLVVLPRRRHQAI